MNVLQLYPKSDYFTGAAIQLLDLAKGLAARGHHVVVATCPGEGWTERCAEVGLPYHAVPMRSEAGARPDHPPPPGASGPRRAEIEHAARMAQAHDFISVLPEGYATQVGERGVKLSGGQAQRLAIARAFLKSPPILILDEATSDLDAESEFLVQQALSELMQGRTVLVIAHRLATVKHADRVVVIHGGRIAETDHDELMAREDGIYRRLARRQSLDVVVPEAEERET